MKLQFKDIIKKNNTYLIIYNVDEGIDISVEYTEEAIDFMLNKLKQAKMQS